MTRPAGTVLCVGVLTLALGVTLAGGLLVGGGEDTVATPFAPPADGLVFGADQLGRDVALRTLRGGLTIVFASAAIAVLVEALGLALGALLAFGRRGGVAVLPLLDAVVIVPSVLVVLTCLYVLGPGLPAVALAVCTVFVPIVARVTRALIRPVLATGYVESALAAGDARIVVLWHEVLPVIAAQLLTDLGLRYVMTLYLVASTAFLGFAPFGDAVDWATMVRQNSSGLALNGWATVLPLVGIVGITVPLNLLVDRSGGDR